MAVAAAAAVDDLQPFPVVLPSLVRLARDVLPQRHPRHIARMSCFQAPHGPATRTSAVHCCRRHSDDSLFSCRPRCQRCNIDDLGDHGRRHQGGASAASWKTAPSTALAPAPRGHGAARSSGNMSRATTGYQQPNYGANSGSYGSSSFNGGASSGSYGSSWQPSGSYGARR